MKFPLAESVCRSVFSFLFLTVFFCWAAFANSSAPVLLTFAELETLYTHENLTPELEAKMRVLLTTPFVENNFQDAPEISQSAPLGEFVRVAPWNIERGLEYEAIEAAFADAQKFEAMLDAREFPPGSERRRKILAEAEVLRKADIIVLNEVDFGMKRSAYRNVAADLAAKLKMNYAFGTQFIELSPVYLSGVKPSDDVLEKELAELIKVDENLYRGLHGTAILSRFPLENVRLVPSKHQPYDWYKTEKKGASWLEKGKRQVAEKVFLEESLREVRRGGRTMLFAHIVDARLPAGRVTIAATHLENRTKSKNRVIQMKELLAAVRPIANPVIIAGDMNTSGSDLTPTSLKREMMKRFGNPRYWIKKGVQFALGFGLVEDILLGGLTFGRTHADPTVRNIPFFSPNPSAKIFSTLENFRFDDGGAFDFRGEAKRATGGKRKTLANSNERGGKGFITTYQTERTLYVIGKNKLDWIFVKPFNLKKPRGKNESYRFAPHFGQTLTEINELLENRISDHRPLIVDLPLNQPNIK